METLLEARGLDFAWSPCAPWFQGVSLSFEPGRIYGLLGRNGAGKTTLLKLLCGLLHPFAGSVAWHGGDGRTLPVSARSPESLADVVFVPENAELPALPAEAFGRLAGSLYPAYSHARYLSLLAAFEVDPRARLSRLSFGQRRKAHIAFALATRARLALLDEPTNGFDIKAQIAFRSEVIAHASEGFSVLVSTHHVREFDGVLDTVVVLEGGRVLAEGPLDAMLAETGGLDLESWYARLLGVTPAKEAF